MLTQHNLSVEVVDQQADELRLNRQLVGQHAQVVAEVCVLCEDHSQTAALILGTPRTPKDLLHVQHPCRSTYLLTAQRTTVWVLRDALPLTLKLPSIRW